MAIVNFLFNVLIVAVSVFGGGPVFIPAFKGILVDGIMNAERFENITTIVNITPGALGSKYALIGGYDLGLDKLGLPAPLAFLVGLAGMSLFIFVAIGMVLVAFKFVHRMNKKPWFARAIEGSSPAVCGILIVIMINFLGVKLDKDLNFEWVSAREYVASAVIFVMALPLLIKVKIKPLYIILCTIALAILTYKLGFVI